MAGRILLVEDNEDFARALKLQLETRGYEATVAGDGEQGLELALTGAFELILLDVSLPKRDGLSVLGTLRKQDNRTPVLMLTSKAEELDKLAGFELGADDYVTKPFSTAELLYRISALLRRAGMTNGEDQERQKNVLNYGELNIDLNQRRVSLHGQELELTAKEFDLLAFLASQPNQAFSREDLLEAVWGCSTDAYAQTINTLVMRIRKKIEKDPANPVFLETVRGYGYRFAYRSE